MTGDLEPRCDSGVTPERVSRRTVLMGLGGAGLAAGLGLPSISRARRSPGGWGTFDSAIRKEFARMGLVGAAVAVVAADHVVHTLSRSESETCVAAAR